MFPHGLKFVQQHRFCVSALHSPSQEPFRPLSISGFSARNSLLSLKWTSQRLVPACFLFGCRFSKMSPRDSLFVLLCRSTQPLFTTITSLEGRTRNIGSSILDYGSSQTRTRIMRAIYTTNEMTFVCNMMKACILTIVTMDGIEQSGHLRFGATRTLRSRFTGCS